MNAEFFKALDMLENEKGISKEYMLEKVEAALLSGFKKDNGFSNVRIELDPVKQNVRVFKQLTVVDPNLEEDIPLTAEYNFDDFDERTDRLIEIEDTTPYGDVFDDDDSGAKPAIIRRRHRFNDKTEITLEDARNIKKTYNLGDIVEVEIKPKNFGRISAQTAKQVIIQGIREAERDRMVREYEGKKEEIVTAIVSRIDPVTGNAVLELGRNEVTLFKNEQIPGERYIEGQKLKVYVTIVKRETKGPTIVLSRKHPGLVKRLFELEVPEIQDGTVIIKSIAREAGSRTKIAVYSREPNVDPIGACIGAKGIRKNSITHELGGEKIDIIKYSENPEEFICASLAPASVVSVTETGDRSCYVLVEDDQLSLAIGKEGQNARLAARLTGYNKIDIKSVSAARAAAFNDIIEGKSQASGSFGENLAMALKSAMDESEEEKAEAEAPSTEEASEKAE